MQHDSRNTDAVVRTRPPTRALALSAALLLAAAGGQTSWASQVAGDFDGDGRDDLAIGVPFEGLGAPDYTAEVGVVNVE